MHQTVYCIHIKYILPTIYNLKNNFFYFKNLNLNFSRCQRKHKKFPKFSIKHNLIHFVNTKMTSSNIILGIWNSNQLQRIKIDNINLQNKVESLRSEAIKKLPNNNFGSEIFY